MASREYVNVTEAVKSMLRKGTPKIHMYRVDLIESVNIVVEVHQDHFTESLEVTLSSGADIVDSKYVKNKGKSYECVTFEVSSVSSLFGALINIIVSEEVKAKYSKPKKSKVTVNDLLNDEKLSSKLKDLLIKEMGL